ncbi:NAD-dependent epimerase/dehydratase family protein [Kutzneria sp. CA-103260]|uniref:NAD-dependent epimerase/dehydratase family protein n=1 Tax=Kutzneria sp. CA-103260 TaxID=2802641 RepID=UPI001BA62EAA|nr:NAD-dependent epimerase/dehydratase family protein [Kutzneria sp. CA-103260]QUQ69950.1 NAD dependent epimerase/dehydratase family protein [Kutzneria sp. CA-103260]
MKVLIVGGTGFVGHHVVNKLVALGHEVSVLARSRADSLSPAATVHIGDIQKISDRELADLVADRDGIVYGAAAAVYSPLKADTSACYRAANIEPVVRLLTAGRNAVCDRAVLLGSYYATLSRLHPELHLLEGSPYIQSRVDQSRQAHQAAGDAMSLTVLELPYVLGATPGRPSSLDPFVQRMLEGKDPLVYPGGTAVAAVSEVADAAVAALEKRVDGDYPIATANLTWADLLRRLAAAAGCSPERVWRLSAAEVSVLFHLRAVQRRRQGVRPGFHTAKISRLHAAEAYVDLDVAGAALGITHADVDQAIRDTALANLG